MLHTLTGQDLRKGSPGGAGRAGGAGTVPITGSVQKEGGGGDMSEIYQETAPHGSVKSTS